MVHLLNFHAEYEPASKIAGAKVRLVCFGDTSTDNHKLNPRNVPSYNCIHGEVPNICELKHYDDRYRTLFKKDVYKWYLKNGNTMLDKIVAYYDSNPGMMQQFCAPVNLIDNHWMIIHVVLPCPKYSNGKVFLTNSAALKDVLFSDQYPKSNVIYSQMWWAK